MIQSAYIKNFQSHENTEIKFAPGVNVIIGPSDSGKSAIFRALNWPITNRPLGNSFCSEWGGETAVTIETEKDRVTRKRNGNTNVYMINDCELTSFGQAVPEQVTEVLQIDRANIQTQMDPPFLLWLSPGEAAKELNKAAALDDIDYVTTGIKKSYNTAKGNMKRLQKEKEKLEEDIKQYDKLPEIEKTLQEVEEKEKEKTQLYEDLKAINNLIRRTKEIKKQIVQAPVIEKALKEIDEAMGALSRMKQEQDELIKLNTLINNAENTHKTIIQTKKYIDKLETEYQEIAPETCPLCGNSMEV